MINRASRVPYYRQIADELADRIARGELDPAGRVPSEAQIQRSSGVSRGTARRAAKELRERGLIETVRQRGSYVSERAATGGRLPQVDRSGPAGK
jgi:DNA-binding GntR family transcriptional regulator